MSGDMIPGLDVLKSLSETFGTMIGNLVNEPAKVVGDIIADQMQLVRLRRQLTILGKAKALCNANNIAMESVPTEFLLPWYEAAGDVENDELQDLWANLLVSGMEDEAKRRAAFIGILKDLSPSDARLLRWIWTITERQVWRCDHAFAHHVVVDFPKDFVGHPLADNLELYESLANLTRLGIYQPQVNLEGSERRLYGTIGDFGFAFLDSIMPQATLGHPSTAD